MFQYDQSKAVSAGESGYINQSGAYNGRITAAKWTRSQKSQAAALELSFEDLNGLKANYISIYYQKADGQPQHYGEAHIHAIMGLLGLQNLSAVQQGNETVCPELIGKPIGLILQKVLITKNDGSDSYRFELVVAFSSRTNKTLKEALEDAPAERVQQIMQTLKDKDEREHNRQAGSQTPPPPQRQAAPQGRPRPVDDIDDSIPF